MLFFNSHHTNAISANQNSSHRNTWSQTYVHELIGAKAATSAGKA